MTFRSHVKEIAVASNFIGAADGSEGEEPSLLHLQEPDGALGAVLASRVRQFRREGGWTLGGLADRAGLSKSMLSKIENAQTSPSLTTLDRLARTLSVPVTAFFRGLDEEHDVLHIKAGTGIEIQHRGTEQGHRYELLGRMRAPHDRFEPLLVTLTERQDVFPLFQHGGTELIYMLRGRMEYGYGSSHYRMEPGDALQFVGEVTHGPAQLLDIPAQFLTVKTTQPSG